MKRIDVYVVTDFTGWVWGVYTKDTKAMARKEQLTREFGQGYTISKVELNSGTQDESGED